MQDDDRFRKRFHKMRPIAQEAIDWKINKHIESQWQQMGHMDGGPVHEEGREVTDLAGYRVRMREKLLSGSEETLMKIIEDYAKSPEYLYLEGNSSDTARKLKQRRSDPVQRDEPDGHHR